MSLIRCPECGKMISSKAEFCPHCGYRPSVNQIEDIRVIPDDDIDEDYDDEIDEDYDDDDEEYDSSEYQTSNPVDLGGIVLGVFFGLFGLLYAYFTGRDYLYKGTAIGFIIHLIIIFAVVLPIIV